MPDDNEQGAGEPIERARRLHDEAKQLSERGDYSAARAAFAQALAIREAALGPAHPDTAESLNELAVALTDLGEYPTARPLFERAVSIRGQALGARHPAVASSLNGLALVLLHQGDAAEAQLLLERALAIREAALGPEHEDTAEALGNLAVARRRRGDTKNAIRLHERALAIRERVLGENHKSTAASLTNLGVLWHSRGNVALARQMHERALAIYERVLGPEHVSTGRALNNLAAVLADQGERAAALPLLERALAIHERALGPDHPSIAHTLINLADIYKGRKEYAAARRLYERALIIRARALGPAHADTRASLSKLRGILVSLNDSTAAIPVHRILEALQKSPTDPRAAAQLHALVDQLAAEAERPPLSENDRQAVDTAAELVRAADQRYAEADYAEARALLERALALREAALGPDHLEHVPILEKLAEVHRAQGDYDAIPPLVERIAEIHTHTLGEQHPLTTVALLRVASVRKEQGGLAAALPLYERAADALAAQAPSGHPLARAAQVDMRALLARVRQMAEAPADTEQREHETTPPIPEDVQRALLAGLDDVDWQALHHAYGPATDVPALLRALLSGDAAERERTWERLYSTIWHQGTVYAASAAAVPFLIRMVEFTGTPGRADILELLAFLAQGSGYLAVHAREEDGAINWREILAEEGKELDAERRHEADWVRATHEAVGAGVPLYLRLLTDADARLRSAAVATLACFPEHAQEIGPHLRRALDDEPDDALRVALAYALSAVLDAGPNARATLRALLESDPNPAVRFLAAAGLAQRAGAETPDVAVSALVAGAPEVDDVLAQHIPDWPGALALATGALSRLDPPRRLDALLRALTTVDAEEATEEIAGVLLDLVFNDGVVQDKATAWSRDASGRTHIHYWRPRPQPARDPTSLTHAQRSVLAALIAHDPLWAHDSDLLALYGLPHERAPLRASIG
jgi:tetratricopeptide (TPR) repeat protein